MEATFVDELHNSLDMRSLQTQSESSSDSMSSRRMHTGTYCSSGQFKVLQHGFWSRINFRSENNVRIEANRPYISSSNPWIQHFRTRTRHGALEPPSTEEKLSLTANSQEFPASDLQLCCQKTSCSDIEVTDQNFVDDYVVEKVNTLCNKKRKITSAVSGSGNNQIIKKLGTRK
uniref:cold-regulated protein 27-like isoform X2 n=1 Tax=Erigeron canadensis TaxID=72917 RepID=UPI001CB90D01|nr:cold-regulated protein 27-like isoform X2 [Erigeron canadensis]